MKDVPSIRFDESTEAGILRAEVVYADASVLAVALVVAWLEDLPAWSFYSFHYMDREGRTRFRYDGAPHEPGLPFFPHHKHIGPSEQPIGHPRPGIRDILNEISTLIDL